MRTIGLLPTVFGLLEAAAEWGVIDDVPIRATLLKVAQVAQVEVIHFDLFEKLYSAVLGRTVALEAPCERWIVWPAVDGYDRDPREDELAELGVRVVGYSELDGGFGFRVGRRVQ